MDQEKFGKFIKEIRKKNNLTQSEFADKYNVSCQAVSKWENGKNLPDKGLILKMSKDFGVSFEDMIEGNASEKKTKNKTLLIVAALIVLIGIMIFCIVNFTGERNFQFKTLSTSCKDFNISGNIAYNGTKSAIYITNIQYCGGEDLNEYKKIECKLYESTGDVEKKISSYKYDESKKIKLEEFLREVTFVVDDYDKICKDYDEESLFLIIEAIDVNEERTIYKVPLKPTDSCKRK